MRAVNASVDASLHARIPATAFDWRIAMAGLAKGIGTSEAAETDGV